MKDLKISKELFNEATNSKCHEVFIKDEFIIAHSNLGMKMVNIYEFAFMCKEWAMNKGYQIISGLSDEPAYRKQDEKAYAQLRYYIEDENGNGEYEDKYFMANTEIEAVVKVSEYILKEINENR